MAPLISVVMATYNGERFIAEAIRSVLDQTFSNFEFIIVDDGSTDATSKIISRFEDDRIRYFKKEKNSGIADSLNYGIKRALGDFIARMDDDDVCMPNRFDEQIKVMEQHEDAVLCATDVLVNTKINKKYCKVSHDDIMMEMLLINPIVHPTVIMRKNALLKHLYNPSKVPSEDYDLWSRLIWEGKFYKIDESLLYYRSHKKSETTIRRKEQLSLNVNIAENMFERVGFSKLISLEDNIKILASHDYSISGKRLRQLISWCEDLKKVNEESKIFSIKIFSQFIENHLRRYIISFFINNTINEKFLAFLYLKLTQKAVVLKYYFKIKT